MAPDLFIDQNCIRVCTQPLPGSVRAFSMPYGDGFTIIVNDSLSPMAKLDALEHELEHIKRGDHFNQKYSEYT
ncbi:MAG: hypothetical protein AB9880_00145 [Christensenellales bacterium]